LGFYIIIALGSEKNVRRAARKYGVRLQRIILREDPDASGVERGVGACVSLRYHQNLKHWFDDSAELLEAAEAALPPEQQAIYKGRDKAARLALDEKLIDNGTVPPRHPASLPACLNTPSGPRLDVAEGFRHSVADPNGIVSDPVKTRSPDRQDLHGKHYRQ
jgi:hypothetical protein